METDTSQLAIIELKNISKAFAKPSGEPLAVLANVNLALRDGDFLGLLGRSGSGKSTLLRIAAGLIKPTSGEVLYRGAPLTGPAEGIAVVSGQFVIIHRRLPGKKNPRDQAMGSQQCGS